MSVNYIVLQAEYCDRIMLLFHARIWKPLVDRWLTLVVARGHYPTNTGKFISLHIPKTIHVFTGWFELTENDYYWWQFESDLWVLRYWTFGYFPAEFNCCTLPQADVLLAVQQAFQQTITHLSTRKCNAKHNTEWHYGEPSIVGHGFF